MSMASKTDILDQLGHLVALEHLAEKLMERASRAQLDPREAAHLWMLATEYRDHARILRRHRKELDRRVADIEYPRWGRGKGPSPEEALILAAKTTHELAGEYRATVSLHDNPYLRKFLMILAEEHDRCAMQLDFLVNGKGIFEDAELIEMEDALAS